MTSRSLPQLKPVTLALVGGGLLLLAGLSLWLSFYDWGGLSVAFALAIAAVKGGLVAGVFMDLKGAPASCKLAALLGLAMVLLLVGFTAADVLTRDAPPLLLPGAEP